MVRRLLALVMILSLCLVISSGAPPDSMHHEGALAQRPAPPCRTETPLVASQIASVTPTSDFSSEEATKTIAVIVQNSLFPNVSSAVSEYCNDLDNSGYQTILFTDPIATVQELKQKLVQWYTYDHLVGAVIIGRLPYALFYHDAVESFPSESFICDLYLMDMDGSWSEKGTPDGTYEVHTGDIQPEIFVSRIDPTCLSLGSGPITEICQYLSRIHSYRTGALERSHRALVYVDDDWAGYWGTQWDGHVGLAYPNRTYIDNRTTTTADDWLYSQLNQDYQWTHICVHSSATSHHFGPGGSGEGIATSAQIWNVPPSFNFYNLFSCSGAKWTTTNNLAVVYTFGGPYSVATVSSTKTGGMMECDYFYSPLHENATLGESLVDWFAHALSNESAVGSFFVQWYYGMTIIGDPLLTICYDCTVLPPVISSPTHPDPACWSNNPRPKFNWSVPKDLNGIEGYYYVLDQQPLTSPSPDTATYTVTNGTDIQHDLTDGAYYLHVVARDTVGNVGKTVAHYRVNIDRTPPQVEVTLPASLYNASTNTISVEWRTYTTLSGYSYSEVWVDNPLNTVYEGTAKAVALTDINQGQHLINVTVFDTAGNRASSQTPFFVDLTDPTVSITNPINGPISSGDFIISWYAYDAESGYRYAKVQIDGQNPVTIFSPDSSVHLSSVGIGSHTITVSVYDWANRTASDSVTIAVFQQPINRTMFPAILWSECGVLACMFFYEMWTRRSRGPSST